MLYLCMYCMCVYVVLTYPLTKRLQGSIACVSKYSSNPESIKTSCTGRNCWLEEEENVLTYESAVFCKIINKNNKEK